MSLLSPTRLGRRNSDRGESASSFAFVPASPTSWSHPSWTPRLWKLARWIMVAYVIFAVLDSTLRIAGVGSTGGAGAFRGRESASSPSPPSWGWTRPPSRPTDGSAYIEALLAQINHQQLAPTLLNHQSTGHVPSPADPLPWSATFPQAVASVQLPYVDDSAFFHLTASDLYAKTFGSALQPMEVVPFYLRARGLNGNGFDVADVTITTLATADRWDALVTLVERYRGPVSVAIYVPLSPSPEDVLASLRALYTSNPMLSTYLDVHLVISPHPRQFNLQRNLARFFARTEFVMMLDVDFVIRTSFRERISGKGGRQLRELLRGGQAALVLPAFEYVDQDDGSDPATFPDDKEELVRLVNSGKIDSFHKFWLPGHSGTNYTRFYSTPTDSIYRVSSYQHAYEPYVVFPRVGPPYCDERFVGYGGNKAACLYQMHLSGIEYYVLGGEWVIHRSHLYAEETRKHERRYNKTLYKHFRSELCYRYLVQFLQSSETIHSPRAKPMLRECRKIPGFAEGAQDFIAHHKATTPSELTHPVPRPPSNLPRPTKHSLPPTT